MRSLLEQVKLATPTLRIRIAGTNGKGSTAFMLSRTLADYGLKTGLYTSPHIHQFNERIRINGLPISNAELVSRLENLIPKVLEIGASYFEMATTLALCFFSDSRVDVEILEAGVGARLDATTSVPADMALLTPIGLDHQNWLGESLSDIAREKAHAMNGCQWAISTPQVTKVAEVLRSHNPNIEILSLTTDVINLAACGAHQRINAALAFAAIQRLRKQGYYNNNLDHARKVIAATLIPGRLQCIEWKERRFWLDAAHNQHAIEALLPGLEVLATPFEIIFVFCREDRCLSGSLHLLRPYTRRLITPSIADEKPDASYERLEDALEAEVCGLKQGNFLILGSFTSVATAENWINRQKA